MQFAIPIVQRAVQRMQNAVGVMQSVFAQPFTTSGIPLHKVCNPERQTP